MQPLERRTIVIDLFQDVHIVHIGCTLFRCQAQARRMLEFGFEPYINLWEPREMVLLATYLPPAQHWALIRNAHRVGQRKLKAWLEVHAAPLFTKASP